MQETVLRSETLRKNMCGLLIAHLSYELVRVAAGYQVRVTNYAPHGQSTRRYRQLHDAYAEWQRQYHEAIGWYFGLDAGFAPANDHQANGQQDRIEHEAMLYQLNQDIDF